MAKRWTEQEMAILREQYGRRPLKETVILLNRTEAAANNMACRLGLKKGNFRTPGDLEGRRHDMAGNAFAEQYWSDPSQLKEDERGYPQPTVWGNLPCHGLFVRHAKGVTLTNCSFTTAQPDPRVDIICVDAPDFHSINSRDHQ